MGLHEDIEAMVRSQGVKLYDTNVSSSVEAGGMKTFEVLLIDDKPVSLDVCAEVSHMLSPLFDITPPVSGEYRLEVGTPGIERTLKKLSHYALSIGTPTKVTLIDGEYFKGPLVSVEGEKITINDETSGEQSFSFNEVQKARTYFEW